MEAYTKWGDAVDALTRAEMQLEKLEGTGSTNKILRNSTIHYANSIE